MKRVVIYTLIICGILTIVTVTNLPAEDGREVIEGTIIDVETNYLLIETKQGIYRIPYHNMDSASLYQPANK